MTDALTVISPRTLDEANKFAATLASANSLPASLKKSPADILAIVLAGAELGIPPMASIRSIHLIDGKPVLSADAMAGLCLRNRDVCEYLTLAVSTDTKATYRAKRKGAPEPVEISFTIEQAKVAGLVGKGNWAKYPAAMLRARAMSAIARAVFPDLVGNLYDPDELDGTAPAEKRVESSPATPPRPATIDALKSDLKKKRVMAVVDVPAAPPASPPRIDGVVLDWPPNRKGKRIETLSEKDCQWCVEAAQEAVEKAPEEERALWLDRAASFTSELMRRGAEKAP